MLSHCVEQGDESLLRFHCFGMVLSKHLLTYLQRMKIPNSSLLIVALYLLKLCEIIYGLGCFGMLRPPRLFANAQGTLEEQFCFSILALFMEEATQGC